MTAINLSTRIRFVNDDGTLTPEAYRTLMEIVSRNGGALGSVGGDTFVSNDFSAIEAQQSAGGDLLADVTGTNDAPAPVEMLAQPTAEACVDEAIAQPLTASGLDEMVMQPPSDALFVDLPQYPTASAPAYKKGRMYFDTTLNKARIGGATAYQTITSV